MSSIRTAWDAVRRAFTAAPSRYAIRGSWAATAYGEPRLTNDVDVVADLTAANLDHFLDALRSRSELGRVTAIAQTALSDEPQPFVSPEDILLAKLHQYRSGGETSEVQWRDVRGIAEAQAGALDLVYLREGAAELGVEDLLARALRPLDIRRPYQ